MNNKRKFYISTPEEEEPLIISKASEDKASMPIVFLALPIILEVLFRIFVSSVDTIMLSTYSQAAVAGVGLVSQYVFFIQILFNVVCIGTSIVLAQYLGAGRTADSKHVIQASIILISLSSIVICCIVILGTSSLLSAYTLDNDVRIYAWEYFVIFGGVGSLFTAFNLLQSTVLRAYGYTRAPMFISFAANIINVIGNAVSLYGPFGLPVFGVKGVAVSSSFSQLVACILLAWTMKHNQEVQFSLKGITRLPGTIYKRILNIGIPTAGENLAYNVAQIVMMAMISTMGTVVMSAQVYTQTIVRFVIAFSVSIGNAVQIKTGYFVGAKKTDEGYKKLYLYQTAATAIAMVLIILINFIKIPIVGLFTKTPEISSLVRTLLLISIYIEFGRSINLITIQALKGAGDIRFPIVYGLFSMWIIMVAGSWFLGLQLGLGLAGIWIATGTEEITRGTVMLFRWRSKKWMDKAIN